MERGEKSHYLEIVPAGQILLIPGLCAELVLDLQFSHSINLRFAKWPTLSFNILF